MRQIPGNCCVSALPTNGYNNSARKDNPLPQFMDKENAAQRIWVNGPTSRFKIQKLPVQNFLTLRVHGVFTKPSCFSVS